MGSIEDWRHHGRDASERLASNSELRASILNSYPLKMMLQLGGQAVSAYEDYFGPTGRLEDLTSSEIIAAEALRRGSMMKQIELTELVGVLRERKPATTLIVGSERKGTAFAILQAVPSNAKVICIDNVHHNRRNEKRVKSFAHETQDFQLLRHNPFDASAAIELNTRVGVRQADFLLLKGEKIHGDIERYWEFYRQYVAPGGLIALHGISGTKLDDSQHIPELWQTIKHEYPQTAEIIEPHALLGTAVWGGIGLVINSK